MRLPSQPITAALDQCQTRDTMVRDASIDLPSAKDPLIWLSRFFRNIISTHSASSSSFSLLSASTVHMKRVRVCIWEYREAIVDPSMTLHDGVA